MSKHIVYRYNPDTDNYERLYPTMRSRLLALLVYLIVGVVVGIALFLVVFYVFDSPTEENLRKENSQLKAQVNLLKRRVDNSLKVMDNIRERDDNFYRVMMQMDPMSHGQIYAGLDNDARYKQLQSMEEGKLLTQITREVDILDRQLYAQSKSFDQLKTEALKQQDRLAHIPSVMPLNIKNYTMASGYGSRMDPVYGTHEFHAGIDFASEQGVAVFATAAGVVKEAGWHGGYGNSIDIDHGYNYLTRYAHLSAIDVRPGQYVQRGEKIGEVGSTGKSTGPHLHYEVRFKDEPQNPVNYYFMDITPEQYEEMIRLAENAGHVMD